MVEPRVSTVISSYNYERFIAETIESVLAQTYPVHEVIVVDDGSQDGSVSVIKKFGGKVKLVEQRNQGVCVARNNGAAIAVGEILTFVDSDDVWLPKKIEQQVSAFEEDPEVGLVSCGFRAFGPGGSTIYESIDGKSGWVADEMLLMREPILNTTASVVAIRRSLFQKIGGFDTRREIFAAEDRDLCYRAARNSKVAFIADVLVDYRMHGSNGHLDIHGMERALHASYEKIFREDKSVLALKKESYGNLHTMLAGSHFRAGNYKSFVRNALHALWFKPSNIGRFLQYPQRLMNRS